MNKEYWEEFYKSFKVKKPSPFAKFVRPLLDSKYAVLDVGCGNGRDTYYLSKKNYSFGIDYANQPRNIGKAKFSTIAVEDLPDFLSIGKPDVLYSRFVLHAITEKEVNILLSLGLNILALECRSDKGVKPSDDHKRRLINGSKLLKKIIKAGYSIKYYEEGTGFAKYKKEDPWVIRILAEK